MKEYIEREAAVSMAHGYCHTTDGRCCGPDDVVELYEELKAIPAADVVEVVRCKDCKWYQLDVWGDKIQCEKIYDVADGDLDGFNFRPSPDHFCSYGERKGGTE